MGASATNYRALVSYASIARPKEAEKGWWGVTAGIFLKYLKRAMWSPRKPIYISLCLHVACVYKVTQNIAKKR